MENTNKTAGKTATESIGVTEMQTEVYGEDCNYLPTIVVEKSQNKKHMFFVDINVVASSKEEVIKLIGKKAYKLCSEIRDMGISPLENKEVE